MKLGCKNGERKKKWCTENVNINRSSKGIRKDITDQDEKERRDVFWQIEKKVIIKTDRPAQRDTDRWKICRHTR